MRWAGGNPRPGAGVPFQEGGPGLRREAQTRQLDHRPRRQPMDPFIQMLRAAQGGQGLNNLAQLYGLSVQQAQIAAEALMPAFAAGLQKRMGSPEGLANIMVLMMRGPYGALYDQRPNSPADFMQPGTNALQALFGSDEVNRAVMNHAAATTGLGTAVMNQMGPGFASLLMGGLTKSLAASGALNQMLAGFMARANGRPEPTGNPWVDALAAMTSSQSMGRGTGNPWIDAFADMMVRSPWGMGGQGTAQANAAATLWQDMVTATLSAMGGAPAKAEPPPPPPPPPPAPPSLGQWPFQDYFAQLFATGFPPGVRGESAGKPYDPFGLLPMAEFWGQMLDRSAGHAHRTPPRERK
ncbi:MAG: hypothetical protein B7X99_17130 [Rhizobiales bacterium 17-65-6]|nr:MAG: hypothetical protein B7X99_17130 [Rhizobiales bacterium 17-65-6]